MSHPFLLHCLPGGTFNFVLRDTVAVTCHICNTFLNPAAGMVSYFSGCGGEVGSQQRLHKSVGFQRRSFQCFINILS